MTDEIPSEPPRKRRQLEAADGKHLAIWANDPNLIASARKRAQNERDRRKRLGPERVVAVLEDDGGSTPSQVEAVVFVLSGWQPTEILKPFTSKSLHRAMSFVGPVTLIDPTEASRAERLIGLPNRIVIPENKDKGLWKHLRQARDRGVDVMVIWPDGSTLTGRW